MGLLAEATVPDTHRWIPAGMTVEYVKKARADLRAVAELDPIPPWGGCESSIARMPRRSAA